MRIRILGREILAVEKEKPTMSEQTSKRIYFELTEEQARKRLADKLASRERTKNLGGGVERVYSTPRALSGLNKVFTANTYAGDDDADYDALLIALVTNDQQFFDGVKQAGLEAKLSQAITSMQKDLYPITTARQAAESLAYRMGERPNLDKAREKIKKGEPLTAAEHSIRPYQGVSGKLSGGWTCCKTPKSWSLADAATRPHERFRLGVSYGLGRPAVVVCDYCHAHYKEDGTGKLVQVVDTTRVTGTNVGGSGGVQYQVNSR